MPKTIKEVPEDLLWGEYDSERDKLEESMAEIRQILKECEPWDAPKSIPYQKPNEAYESAIIEYTANIEKRLG